MDTGQQIGHYKILRPLGAGAMGEVYLALDGRLKREVAIKVLPERLRSNQDRLQRFRREAEAAASLINHNIATIHSLEEIDGPGGEPQILIVMEYVPGKTLKESIPKGGMDIDTFFATFAPLADALAHAHEQGRIHRDLKPGNIMISEDGTPKILDFGLARIVEQEPTETPGSGASELGPYDETMTMVTAAGSSVLSGSGQITGTPLYMSPEQALGEDSDVRSDLFSFGIMMYEAWTGQRPFGGKTLDEVLRSIQSADPVPITKLRSDSPYSLWAIIRRCLKKDRNLRMQSARIIGDELREVLDEVGSGTVLVVSDGNTVAEMQKSGAGLLNRLSVLIAALVLIGLISGYVAWMVKPSSVDPVRKYTISTGARVNRAYNLPTISPDGRMVAFSKNGALWVRHLDELEATRIEGTDAGERPFWSPDSKSLGYFDLLASSMKVISVSGRATSPVTVCQVVNVPRGAAWGSLDRIVFSTSSQGTFDFGSGLWEVSASGGTPRSVVQADTARGEIGIAYPHYLPDGVSLLYAVLYDDNGGAIASQIDGHQNIIIKLDHAPLASPWYDPAGYIVYQRGHRTVADLAPDPTSFAVWAVQVDRSSFVPIGDPFSVAIQQQGPSVSSDGTLVFSSASDEVESGQMALLARDGTVMRHIGKPQADLSNPDISPDGTRIAVNALVDGNTDIWIHDSTHSGTVRETYYPGLDWGPVWSPDGQSLAWMTIRNRGMDVYWRGVDDRAGPVPIIANESQNDVVYDWSRDGRYLVYTTPTNGGRDGKRGNLDQAYKPGSRCQFLAEYALYLFLSLRLTQWEVRRICFQRDRPMGSICDVVSGW